MPRFTICRKHLTIKKIFQSNSVECGMATGCVKILRKALDFNHDGKYIPEHKRGPDIDLFRNQSVINHEHFHQKQQRPVSTFLQQTESFWFDLVETRLETSCKVQVCLNDVFNLDILVSNFPSLPQSLAFHFSSQDEPFISNLLFNSFISPSSPLLSCKNV